MEPISNADQVAHGFPCATDINLGGLSDNLTAEEHHLEKGNNLQISDFPHPEVLLSMPNLPPGISGNFFVDSTPGKELLAKDVDATDDNAISGRKRSFTESTMTFQSLNSVVSSGGAQSKGTVESVPNDNDLLSSILGNKLFPCFGSKLMTSCYLVLTKVVIDIHGNWLTTTPVLRFSPVDLIVNTNCFIRLF